MRKMFFFIGFFCILSSSAYAYDNTITYMGIASLLITLPAFIALYIHLQKTNLGKTLIQPMLAMFIGFFGIMLNSIIELLRVTNKDNTENFLLIMSINRTISSILIGIGCVVLFFKLLLTKVS